MKESPLKGFLEAVGEYGRALPKDLQASFGVALSELESQIVIERDRYWRGMDRLKTSSQEISRFQNSPRESAS